MAGIKTGNNSFYINQNYENETKHYTQLIKGLFNASFTNMSNTSASFLDAGSVIESNGSVFVYDSVTSISGTLTADSENYITIDDTGVLTYTSIAPTWDVEKNGWYGSGIRYIFRFDYDGSIFENKTLLKNDVYLYSNGLSTLDADVKTFESNTATINTSITCPPENMSTRTTNVWNTPVTEDPLLANTYTLPASDFSIDGEHVYTVRSKQTVIGNYWFYQFIYIAFDLENSGINASFVASRANTTGGAMNVSWRWNETALGSLPAQSYGMVAQTTDAGSYYDVIDYVKM